MPRTSKKQPAQPEVKTFNVERMGIQWLVDRIHVGTSDFSVAKEFAKRCRNSKNTFTKEQRKAVMRFAVQCHRENRQLYLDVYKGTV